MCIKCCDNINFIYDFNNKCIENLKTFLDYKTKLCLFGRDSSELTVKVIDIREKAVSFNKCIELDKIADQKREVMSLSNYSEHNETDCLIEIKSEQFDKDFDCTQYLDVQLKSDDNKLTKMEHMQDIKTEVEDSDSAINEKMNENILDTDVGDTEIKIKIEYKQDEDFGNEVTDGDDFCGNIGKICYQNASYVSFMM